MDLFAFIDATAKKVHDKDLDAAEHDFHGKDTLSMSAAEWCRDIVRTVLSELGTSLEQTFADFITKANAYDEPDVDWGRTLHHEDRQSVDVNLGKLREFRRLVQEMKAVPPKATEATPTPDPVSVQLEWDRTGTFAQTLKGEYQIHDYGTRGKWLTFVDFGAGRKSTNLGKFVDTPGAQARAFQHYKTSQTKE